MIEHSCQECKFLIKYQLLLLLVKVHPTHLQELKKNIFPSHRLHRYCRSEQSPARATREWSSRWTCSSFSRARNASLPGWLGRLGTWWQVTAGIFHAERWRISPVTGEVTGQISGVENVPSYFNVCFSYFYIYIYIILYTVYRSLHFWRGFPSGQPYLSTEGETLQSCLKSLKVVLSLDQDEQAENIRQFGCQMVVTVWV